MSGSTIKGIRYQVQYLIPRFGYFVPHPHRPHTIVGSLFEGIEKVKKVTQFVPEPSVKNLNNFSHIYFTHFILENANSIINDKTYPQLSFIGKDCEKIPPIIQNRYGSRVVTLDLSFNSLTTLQGLECFYHLRELVLDNNTLSDNVLFPKMTLLHTLSINKNKITDLELFLRKVQQNFPSIKYLSMLGNKACPNQLSDLSKDDEDYRRYRYYVINQLPNLQFLDSTPVTKDEKVEAQRRGHLMKIVTPQNTRHDDDDECLSSPNQYTPLPRTRRSISDHKGAYGKCRYRYSGKHSEGNRFIQNHDL